MGENRPRICGVKTVRWTVFRFERPSTLARAGGRRGWGGVVGRGVPRRFGEGESGQAPTYEGYNSSNQNQGSYSYEVESDRAPLPTLHASQLN